MGTSYHDSHMLFCKDGIEIRVADRVTFGPGEGVVEDIVEGDEVERWGLDRPGFLLIRETFGRLLITAGGSDREDFVLVGRASA